MKTLFKFIRCKACLCACLLVSGLVYGSPQYRVEQSIVHEGEGYPDGKLFSPFSVPTKIQDGENAGGNDIVKYLDKDILRDLLLANKNEYKGSYFLTSYVATKPNRILAEMMETVQSTDLGKLFRPDCYIDNYLLLTIYPYPVKIISTLFDPGQYNIDLKSPVDLISEGEYEVYLTYWPWPHWKPDYAFVYDNLLVYTEQWINDVFTEETGCVTELHPHKHDIFDRRAVRWKFTILNGEIVGKSVMSEGFDYRYAVVYDYNTKQLKRIDVNYE